MTSRERILGTLKQKEVDKVPVPQGFWTGGRDDKESFQWDSLEDAISWKKQFSFDPYLEINWLPCKRLLILTFCGK